MATISSASSSSFPSLPSLPGTNTSHFEKLDQTNYLPWLRQMKPFLVGHGLWKFVAGTHPQPPATITVPTDKDAPATTIPNPAYDIWVQQDQLTVSHITGTFTREILNLTVGYETSKEIWDALTIHFAQRSVANEAHIRMQLFDMNKGNQSVDEYLQTAKSLADSLASIGEPVSNKDLVLAVLRGLGPDYMMLRTAILNTPPLPDFSELRSRILTFETSNPRPGLPHTGQALMMAQPPFHPPSGRDFNWQPNGQRRNNNSPHNRGGHRSSGKRGRRSWYSNNPQQQHPPSQWTPAQHTGPWRPSQPTAGILGPPWCSTCHTNQHTHATCPHRYTCPEYFPAFAGHVQHDPTWYADSGATHHMTGHSTFMGSTQPT